MYEFLSTPAVVADIATVENNIKRMIEGAARYGIAHRPHIKTHRSSEIAKLQLYYGAKGITCAKLGEAEVMADKEIDDILIAYPMVGADKLERYGKLWRRCKLRSVINDLGAAKALSDSAQRQGECYEVLIDIDGGVCRGGVAPGEDALRFARNVAEMKGIRIVGLLYYPGTIYAETTPEGIEKIALSERENILSTAVLLRENGFDMEVLSGGNTPSSKMPHCLEGLTEIRAGNYVFNDCAQLNIGRVREEDCALRVVSTVIARPHPNAAIIDAGSKTLSSDMLPNNGNRYGYIVGYPLMELFKLNEEHGFVRSEVPITLGVGDRITIIPNHACVVSNLADKLYGMRYGRLEREIIIDARGKSS